jgi:hypothetical protein
LFVFILVAGGSQIGYAFIVLNNGLVGNYAPPAENAGYYGNTKKRHGQSAGRGITHIFIHSVATMNPTRSEF